MGHIYRLLDLILSPYGIVAIGILIIILYIAKTNKKVIWFLLGGLLFFTSLAKYADKWEEAPTLVFPLETLRSMGRPLSIAMLALLIILSFNTTPKKVKRNVFPMAIIGLIIVQYLILIKSVLFTDVTFSIIYFLLFVFLIAMLVHIVGKMLYNKENFDWAAKAIAIAGCLFIYANTYQAIFDIQAITFLHGRFSGTSGNPNHAAIYLAGIIPSFMYFMEKNKSWKKAFWAVSLCIAFFWLFTTGSRTGFGMGILIFVLYYWNRLFSLLKKLTVAATILVSISLILPNSFSFLDDFAIDSLSSRYQKIQKMEGMDSRDRVWKIELRDFRENPIFGAPVRKGERIIFGESSWLGVAAQFGWTGLLPMLFFGVILLYKIGTLFIYSLKYREERLLFMLPLSGLAALFVGSFAEAYLLGNLSFPLICTVIYLMLGNFSIHYVQEKNTVQENSITPRLQNFVFRTEQRQHIQ